LFRFPDELRLRSWGKVVSYITDHLACEEHVVVWTGGSLPIYAGVETVIISADSSTMVSEACATTLPVFVVGVELCKGRFIPFHHYLAAHGYTSRLALHGTDFETMAVDRRGDITRSARLDDTGRAAAIAARRWMSRVRC